MIKTVPSIYLVDEELAKLSLVYQLVRLGLTEYFDREKDDILAQIYRLVKFPSLYVFFP